MLSIGLWLIWIPYGSDWVFACAALGFCLPMALAFPCFLSGLLALPLCGAGTYFSLPAAKRSKQEKAA
jgi:hypothetical protein